MAKKPPKMIDMFGESVTDMSLFSQTAVRAEEEVFTPKISEDQPTLFSVAGNSCRVCYGTGKIVIKNGNKPKKETYCTCPAGQQAKIKDSQYYCPNCQCSQCKHLRGE